MHPTRGLGWVGGGLQKMENGSKGEEMKNIVERQLASNNGANLSLTGWLSVARYYELLLL